MLVVLISWLVINLIVLILLLHNMAVSSNPWDLLVYPRLHEFFKRNEVESLGLYVFDILFTLMILPAMLIYYIVFLLIMILVGMLLCLLKLFEKEK